MRGANEKMSIVDSHQSNVEDQELVSVLIPCYNSERFINETINSVLSQTYPLIEIIVVDDCSTDRTTDIVKQIAKMNSNVTLLMQPENYGVAQARNRALSASKGRYIAYLDSDDTWLPSKLERQISFLKKNCVACCVTDYETIEEDGSHRNYVAVPEIVDYDAFLKNTITCSHTIVFDVNQIDKQLLVMPDLRRGQDAATWLQVLRSGKKIYGLNEVLAKNRKRSGSVSSNKLKAVKRTWYLYRKVEKLKLPYAVYCLGWQLFHAVQKRRRR